MIYFYYGLFTALVVMVAPSLPAALGNLPVLFQKLMEGYACLGAGEECIAHLSAVPAVALVVGIAVLTSASILAYCGREERWSGRVLRFLWFEVSYLVFVGAILSAATPDLIAAEYGIQEVICTALVIAQVGGVSILYFTSPVVISIFVFVGRVARRFVELAVREVRRRLPAH